MLPDSFFEELYNSLDTSLISSINYSGHKGNLTIDISNIGTLTYISSYCQSLTLINGNVIDHDFSLSCYNTSIESFIIDDASTIINTSNAWTLCRNLKHFEAPGIKIRFSLNYAPLSFSEIEDIIYNQIADLTGDTSQSLSFTNCYGAADAGMAALATWAASNKNWTIIY
jgi:hypothetical protein